MLLPFASPRLLAFVPLRGDFYCFSPARSLVFRMTNSPSVVEEKKKKQTKRRRGEKSLTKGEGVEDDINLITQWTWNNRRGEGTRAYLTNCKRTQHRPDHHMHTAASLSFMPREGERIRLFSAWVVIHDDDEPECSSLCVFPKAPDNYLRICSHGDEHPMLVV